MDANRPLCWPMVWFWKSSLEHTGCFPLFGYSSTKLFLESSIGPLGSFSVAPTCPALLPMFWLIFNISSLALVFSSLGNGLYLTWLRVWLRTGHCGSWHSWIQPAGLKMIRKKIVYILNMPRLFSLSVFPKQCRVTAVYTAFTLWWAF